MNVLAPGTLAWIQSDSARSEVLLRGIVEARGRRTAAPGQRRRGGRRNGGGRHGRLRSGRGGGRRALLVPTKSACPGVTAGVGLAVADGDTLCRPAPEHAPPTLPAMAPGADARRDLVAARPPTLPRDGRRVRGARAVKRREQREQ